MDTQCLFSKGKYHAQKRGPKSGSRYASHCEIKGTISKQKEQVLIKTPALLESR